MTDRDKEQTQIGKDFAESAEKHFGRYASLVISSGSFAYGGAEKGKSDIDIMTVLDNSIQEVPHDELLLMLRAFVDDYIAIHQSYGYLIDDVFPGEYITDANVEDAIAGRGLHVSESGLLYLPPASNEYYLGNPERLYRAWRSTLAFSKRLYGDEEKFNTTKLRAWETIMLFLLPGLSSEKINSDTVLNALTGQEDKWQGVGVTRKCLTFCEDERPYIEQTLVRLKIGGLLSLDTNGFRREKEKIEAWHRKVAAHINNGSIRKSPFLISKDDNNALARYAVEVKRRKLTVGKLETDKYSASPMVNKFMGECVQVVYTVSEEEQAKNGLTDRNIIIFIKTPKNPLEVPSSGQKLFDKEHFKGTNVLLRISSACVHGSLGDTECSCYQDTIDALTKIGSNGSGIFVYMPQDAQGRGLRDKVRDHRLIYGVSANGEKMESMNTDKSLATLHPEGYDIRFYHILKSVFAELGLDGLEFTMLGDNAQKINKIRTETGLAIVAVLGLKQISV